MPRICSRCCHSMTGPWDKPRTQGSIAILQEHIGRIRTAAIHCDSMSDPWCSRGMQAGSSCQWLGTIIASAVRFYNLIQALAYAEISGRTASTGGVRAPDYNLLKLRTIHFEKIIIP